MAVFLATYSPLTGADLDGQMRAGGALPLWPGSWLIDAADLTEATGRLRCLRAAAGHVLVRIDPGQLDAMMAFGVTREARLFFQQVLAPAIMAARPEIRERGTLLQIGTPRSVVMSALTAAVEDPLAGRPVSSLCRLMLEEGSDKSLGWHVYAPIYMDLIATIAGGVRSVFEFGLGSNHADQVSNMGPMGVPGASLRAWRKFLPESFIAGADVDRRVLFQEPGILTYYVDQLKPETITAMWDEAGPQPRDLIIDDGLHTFEAAENTLAHSLSQISERGLYIIEDILVDQAPAYVAMAEKYGLSGAAIVIASPVNDIDNTLMVLHR